MVDEVDGHIDPYRLGHVVVQEEERVLAVVLDVVQRAGLEVVDTDHAVAALEERVAEM